MSYKIPRKAQHIFIPCRAATSANGFLVSSGSFFALPIRCCITKSCMLTPFNCLNLVWMCETEIPEPFDKRTYRYRLGEMAQQIPPGF